jgi:hypothetical protein
MSYEFLTTVVVINAIATFLLWRKLASKTTNRPKLKKWAATELWDSAPIVPRHDPPKAAGGEYPALVDDVDRLFFADFKDFADVVNWWLADEFTASRFRLQDLPDDDMMLNVDHSNGPTPGRAFAIYHNQTKVGRLEIHPAYKYSTESPKVHTNVEIDWARFVGFDELTEFLGAIAMHVTSPDRKSEDYIAAGLSIQYALIKVLWYNYRVSQYDNPDDEDWGELNLSFQGTADFYIDRKDAPARPKSAAATPSNKRSEKSGVSAPSGTAIVIGLLFVVLIIGGLFSAGADSLPIA